MPDIRFDDAPSLGCFLDDSYCQVSGIKKLSAERRNAVLVKLGGLDQFRFRIGMVNQAHPIARRAACMTSS